MKNAVPQETPVQSELNFLEWFQREYLKRRQKNENYSIRAFSKYLQISPATISHLLAGKRTPSEKFANKLFRKLYINPYEKEFILKSLSKSKRSPLQSNDKYNMIAFDSFKLISDWYHYTILEMTSTIGFKNDSVWIANKLEISVTEVRQALERLIRLNLLIEKNGILSRTEKFITNGDDALTSSAHKNLQRDLLQKALNAIDTIPIEEKDISSITMAIDESKISEAKKMITKFRRDMCKFLEGGPQTRVYNLGIQLYPISKKYK